MLAFCTRFGANTAPAVIKLAPVVLPVAFSVPATLTPVPVNTATPALPATLTVTFPLPATETLLLPFAINDVSIPVKKAPLPTK